MSTESFNTSLIRSSVAIYYEGTLEELANDIAQGLNLPEFFYKSESEPPHRLVAMSEFLGLETWLYSNSEIEGFNYLFKFETTINSETTKFLDQPRADLSGWFACHMKIIFPFKVKVADNG